MTTSNIEIINTVAIETVLSFDVQAKRWTDTYGNTYFSVVVSAEQEKEYVELGAVSFAYGYDDAYTQKAVEIIKETVTGITSEESSLWRLMDDLKLKCNTKAINVKRKKDL